MSRTLVFDAPRHPRSFFEALVADNLDIGRPDTVELIFHGARKRGELLAATEKELAPIAAAARRQKRLRVVPQVIEQRDDGVDLGRAGSGRPDHSAVYRHSPRRFGRGIGCRRRSSGCSRAP